MSTENEQTVVEEVETPAQPGAETGGAQEQSGDDLDALLAQFSQDTTKPEPQKPPVEQQTRQDDDRVARIEQRLFEDDVSKAVISIKGDLQVSDTITRGWLDGIAVQRPQVAKAFENRFQNPQGWKSVEKALAKEFAKEIKAMQPFDQNATEDRELVASAVKGASSTKAPVEPPPKMGGMSNAEYRDYCRKEFGFDPGV